MGNNTTCNLLLDGKFSSAAISAFGFVDTSICTAADEAHDFVALGDSLLVVVACKHSRVCWIYVVSRRRFSTCTKSGR
jgi:hypothetical protein